MSVSEAQKRSNAKHDKINWQYITFKSRVGSKDRIVEAAAASGLSINGFIRDAISKAVMKATGKTLEPTYEETAKAILLRIVDEVSSAIPIMPPSNKNERNKIESNFKSAIESNPSLYEDFLRVLTSELPPKSKSKKIREIENKKRKEIWNVILDA